MTRSTNEVRKPVTPLSLTQVRERIRFHHFAPYTEKSYVHWIRFDALRSPEAIGQVEVEAFFDAFGEGAQCGGVHPLAGVIDVAIFVSRATVK